MTTHSFWIPEFRHLAPDGSVLPIAGFECNAQELLEHVKLTFPELVRMYELMVIQRHFDERLFNLNRQGSMGTCAGSYGEEAFLASSYALLPNDVLAYSYREGPVMLERYTAQGKTIPEALCRQALYWGGDITGNDAAGAKDFPIAVPIGTQILHAAGAALALKMQKKNAISVVYGGDGMTSTGDFYEGLNFAGALKLPLLVIVRNNGWAISVSRKKQTAAQTLAQKGIAAGIECQIADGNDAVALFAAVSLARERVLDGCPVLIECPTYRLGLHTTADDDSRYRDRSEVAEHHPLEPLRRLRLFLENAGEWNAEKETALIAEAKARVQDAVDQYKKWIVSPPRSYEIFDGVYTEVCAPPGFDADRREFRAHTAPLREETMRERHIAAHASSTSNGSTAK